MIPRVVGVNLLDDGRVQVHQDLLRPQSLVPDDSLQLLVRRLQVLALCLHRFILTLEVLVFQLQISVFLLQLFETFESLLLHVFALHQSLLQVVYVYHQLPHLPPQVVILLVQPLNHRVDFSL